MKTDLSSDVFSTLFLMYDNIELFNLNIIMMCSKSWLSISNVSEAHLKKRAVKTYKNSCFNDSYLKKS